jgi:hypothetical protein
MTEAEWLACNEPASMLEYVREFVSERKLRLLAVAYLGRISHLLGVAALWDAVDVAEQFADGWATVDDLRQAYDTALIAVAAIDPDPDLSMLHQMSYPALAAVAVCSACHTDIGWKVKSAADYANEAIAAHRNGVSFWSPEAKAQCELVRDVTGNPFRPVAVEPDWLSIDVVAIAKASYDARAFDHLPILADALEEAGCDNADILAHCRSDRSHVRGCWVVDRILGKE